MQNKKQQSIIEIIQKNSQLELETKNQFIEKISKMNSQEIEFLLKAIQKANEKNSDIQNEIAKLQDIEENGHGEFRQILSELSEKVLAHQTKKQTELDENKSEDILNKIKYL